jgi:uncharacterized protein (TIGR03382 family)
MICRTMCGVVSTIAVSTTLSAQVFDFNTLVHGEIVASQFAPALTVLADNPNRSFDIVAGFDTQFMGSTSDPDLIGPPWDGGNLAVSATEVVLGTALILSENNTGAGDGILDNPDDEGSRPAGSLTFLFDAPVPVFGFDIIDIEGVIMESSTIDFLLNGVLVGNVDFADFVSPASPFFDPTVAFGNNHANRISPIAAADFGALGFDGVVINLGGSSAIDTIVVPAPAAAALGGVALLAAGRRRR